jgi:hypothetical protein
MPALSPTKRPLLKLVSGSPLFRLAIGLLTLPGPGPAQSAAVTFSPGDHDMFIVAHEDDDLLFMSPDLATRIQAGDHVRTV